MPMNVPSDPMPIDPLPPTTSFPIPSAPGATAALRATAGVEPSTADPARLVLQEEPAPEALEAVQFASDTFEQLRRAGRELRFSTDGGIMRIEVYDGTGQLLRTIPPNEALALASREASWQA